MPLNLTINFIYRLLLYREPPRSNCQKRWRRTVFGRDSLLAHIWLASERESRSTPSCFLKSLLWKTCKLCWASVRNTKYRQQSLNLPFWWPRYTSSRRIVRRLWWRYAYSYEPFTTMPILLQSLPDTAQVGCGGEYDATNVFDTALSIICSVCKY